MKKDVLDLTSDDLLYLVERPVIIAVTKPNYTSTPAERRPKVTVAGVLEYIVIDGEKVAFMLRGRSGVYHVEDANVGLTIEFTGRPL